MGETYKIAMELQRERETKQKLEEAARQQMSEENERMWLMREAAKKAVTEKHENFIKYKQDVKDALLSEALTKICIGSIKNPSSSETAMCEALVWNYVKEQGAEELLDGFNNKTSFLESLNRLVSKYYKKIVENADENDPDSMIISKNNIDDFFDELSDTENIDDVTNTIRMRVANAEEDFVNKTAMDRENLKSIIKDTSQRVTDARLGMDNDYSDDSGDDLDKGPEIPTDEGFAYVGSDEVGNDDGDGDGDDDLFAHDEPKDTSPAEPAYADFEYEEYKEPPTEEEYRESVIDAKRKIINVIESRNKTVFEQMVRNLAEASVTNADMREQFVIESGRIDMDRIVESVRCMYTMLEMVSTLKIEKVDAEYIQSTIESIK